MENKINDGGAAFPEGIAVGVAGDVYGGNSSGMSLRDYFAAKAMQGLCTGCSGTLGKEFSAYAKGACNAVISERSYVLADAMIKAREATND